jgi:outer membrane usher protein
MPILRPLTLVLILFYSVSSDSHAGNRAILEIVVNGHNVGQQFVQVTPDEDVLLTVKLLKELRMRQELWSGQDGERISLRALAPNIQFSLDQNNATLNLAVPPHWFEKLEIRKESPSSPVLENEPLRPLDWSGFFNYVLQANFSGEAALVGLDMPWEVGFNHGQWLALGSFNSRYEADGRAASTVRQTTSLLWDDPENMRGLVLGDFSPPYQLLSGGGNFGGVSWRKNFRLDRNFRYAADLSLETLIESPTHARLYSNGRQIKEWDLLPGVVSFSDISSYAGADAELVLTDAFGREQRLSVPSYTSQQVLKKGLHEYAYSLGWQRENFGLASNDYGKLTALGFHRYGFGDTWTGGGVFGANEDTVSAGPTFAALLGGSGQIETGFMLSQDKYRGSGYTATARYSYRYKQLNAYLGLTANSLDYVAIPSSKGTDYQDGVGRGHLPRYQGNLSLSYSGADWGGLSMGYAENARWSGYKNRLLSLNYRRSFDGLQLNLGFKRDLEVENSDEIYLMFQYFPYANSDLVVPYDTLSAESRYQQTYGRESKFSLQKNYPRGTGYGYVADIGDKGGNLFASARGQYRTERGIFSASANHSAAGLNTGSLSVAGGVVLIEDGIYQGRPVTDSFAVVQVEGLESVIVESGNTQAGRAGAAGALLVPDLVSYNQNRVSIATPSLLLDYTGPVLSQTVEVKQRSGTLITFQFTRFTAVEGNLYLLAGDGERIGLEAVPVEFVVNGEKREAYIGLEGYFYLENLPVGEHLLRVRLAGGDCLARIDVPDSERIVTNLGALACVMEGKGVKP